MNDEVETELEKINPTVVENGQCEKKEILQYQKHNPFRRQALMALGTFMITLGAGTTSGFSAVLNPQLEHEKLFKHSRETDSWIAAIASFALLFGNMMSGYVMDRFGRRRSQIMLSITFLSGWMIIGLANNIALILLGRFITGFCQGWLGPLGPVFVGEISAPVHRGLFLAALSLSIASGVFISHLLGTVLHWSIAAILCGLFPLIGGIILYFGPESPVWYASKNQIEECIESFQWYRGKSPEMKVELDKIIAEQTKKDKSKGKIQTLITNIKKPEFWKPLCIMMWFFTITQLSGINVVCAYTTEMMKELIGNSENAHMAMLSIDILRVVSLAGACFVIKRLGRRPLAIFSGTFTSLSMMGLATYMYLSDKHIIKHMSPVITLGLMATYIIVSNLGITPLPWNMVGELFATETKGLGSGIAVISTSIAFFATVKSAPAMFDSMGHHGTYLFYGICTLVGTVVLYFFLPETRGKTLLQIEEHFRYGRRRKSKETHNDDKEAA